MNDEWCFVESVERSGYNTDGCFIQSISPLVFGYRMYRGEYQLVHLFGVNTCE